MMVADSENLMAIEGDSSSSIVTPELFVKNTRPYSDHLVKKRWKKKLLVSKQEIGKEINRRCNSAKVNVGNKSIEKLMRQLSLYPLINPVEISFVKKEDDKFRAILNADLMAEDEDVISGSGRQRDTDRLRFMICLCDDDIRSLYLKSQTPKDKDDVDYRNSDEKSDNWIDLMLVMFNKPDDLLTDIVPNLHEKFRQQIVCPKGKYELTRQKCTDLLQDGKGKLRGIIRRYNLSGNGSDMATFDEDTDGEEEVRPELLYCVQVCD